MAKKLMAEKEQEVTATAVETPTDMFSFDTPEEETTTDTGTFLKDDPFDFGDEAPTTPPVGDEFAFGKEQKTAQAKAEEDAFADLLESSGHNKGRTMSALQPAEANNQAELDLNDFNWDDIPDAAPSEAARPAKDDFNSLFGSSNDTAKK